MKKLVTIFAVLVLSWMLLAGSGEVTATADWWQRPTAIPTQPSFPRNLEPTSSVHPTIAPTSGPSQPTVAPTSPPTGETPSSGGGSSEDACAAGKSYVGPYCGWSPSTSSSGGGGGGGGGGPEQPRVGGPQVLGLSNTSSSDVGLSDIIFLAGVLCLALYARSKIAIDNQSR